MGDFALASGLQTLVVPLVMGLGASNFSQTMLLPHVMFSLLFHKYRDSFDRLVLGTEGAVHQFWEDTVGCPQFEAHPIKTRDLSKAIPVSLHGDGAASIGYRTLACSHQRNLSAAIVLFNKERCGVQPL